MLTFSPLPLTAPLALLVLLLLPIPARAEVNQPDPLWWLENAQNQTRPDTLKTASEVIENPYNTCGPTVVAMMVNYLYAQAGIAFPRITPSQTILAAEKLGYYRLPFGGREGLLGLGQLAGIARQFGLEVDYPPKGKTYLPFDELYERLQTGQPAIVALRYDYQAKTGRYLPTREVESPNHFIIAFGTFRLEGEEYVWTLNPLPGRGLDEDSDVRPFPMKLEDFHASWAKNDGSNNSEIGFALFLRLREAQTQKQAGR